jgi:hypothetical protein
VAIGGMGAVEGAVRDVEAVGEVGEGSFLANDFFSLARLFWNHTFSHQVGEVFQRSRWGRNGVENTYLNLPGRHLEFFGEVFAPGSIRFLVGDKDTLQYLKLGGGGALACLDSVRDVCVKHLRVDFGGIHAGWNERGNVRTVGSWGGWGEGRGGGMRRVAQQHNPLGRGEGEGEKKKRRSESV